MEMGKNKVVQQHEVERRAGDIIWYASLGPVSRDLVDRPPSASSLTQTPTRAILRYNIHTAQHDPLHQQRPQRGKEGSVPHAAPSPIHFNPASLHTSSSGELASLSMARKRRSMTFILVPSLPQAFSPKH